MNPTDEDTADKQAKLGQQPNEATKSLQHVLLLADLMDSRGHTGVRALMKYDFYCHAGLPEPR